MDTEIRISCIFLLLIFLQSLHNIKLFLAYGPYKNRLWDISDLETQCAAPAPAPIQIEHCYETRLASNFGDSG